MINVEINTMFHTDYTWYSAWCWKHNEDRKLYCEVMNITRKTKKLQGGIYLISNILFCISCSVLVERE